MHILRSMDQLTTPEKTDTPVMHKPSARKIKLYTSPEAQLSSLSSKIQRESIQTLRAAMRHLNSIIRNSDSTVEQKNDAIDRLSKLVDKVKTAEQQTSSKPKSLQFIDEIRKDA